MSQHDRDAATPDERAFREAERRANARVGFTTHLVVYASVCGFLLLVAGVRPAFIVALGWGIGVAFHYFGAVVVPGMRRRVLDREVRRQIRTDVPRERRTRSERHVRSLEELAAGVAHEIRNPITAARSLVQQMGEDPGSAQNVEYAKLALDELDRVERSVAHLLRYAREEDLRPVEVRLRDVIDAALDPLRERVAARGVTLESDVETDAVLRADPEKLRRVLVDLVDDALDALEHGGTPAPRVEVAAGENLAGTECWVRVRDNGPGLDPDALSRIFSPFYARKTSGTGLGLALSKKVVDAHGGSIEAHASPGSGAEFTVTIPKRSERPSGGRPRE